MAIVQIGFNLATASISAVGTIDRDSETGKALAISGTVNGQPITGLSDFRGADNTLSVQSSFGGVQRYAPSALGLSFSSDTQSFNIRNIGGQTFQLVATSSANPSQQEDAGTFFGAYSVPICFVRGTQIRTVRGEVAVEDLRIGDLAVTASGAHKPIRWIAHRIANAAYSPEPQAVWPVRIQAGALAMGVPVRDLLVSPDHCLVFDDVLVPAKHLINGATIRQEPVEAVEYWHIELDRHVALLAEGLPAESYRDCGMLAFFEGAASLGVRAVDGAAIPLLAPHVMSGPRLHAIKGWLISRARHLGAQRHSDPALSLVADGRMLEPKSIDGRRFTFDVPEGTQALALHSRRSVPAHWIADNEDYRTLGVRVSDLRLDGEPVSMTDERLSLGWNAVEPNGRERWTMGAAYLPVCRTLSFEADWFLGYPVATPAEPHCRMVNG